MVRKLIVKARPLLTQLTRMEGIRGAHVEYATTTNQVIPKLISVHFPKAAGSSLLKTYETRFGSHRVLHDDSSDPLDPCGTYNLDPARYEDMKPTSLGDYAAVHGHFHVGRFEYIPDAVRVVVLREPVDNLISIYYYWSAIRHRNRRYRGHCLYRYFCDMQPSLLEFAAIPALRYLMTGVYFRKVDMACFDAIGDYADMNGYSRQIGNLLGIELGALPKANETAPSAERCAVWEDRRTLTRLRDLLADDTKFYDRYARR